MTIEGAIVELQNLIDSEEIPFWAKPSLRKILETVEAEREEHLWIPVTERLPEESYDSIIGWDAQRERCVFVQFYNGQFQISGSNETFDIKAWMPLPKPYEEGAENEDSD